MFSRGRGPERRRGAVSFRTAFGMLALGSLFVAADLAAQGQKATTQPPPTSVTVQAPDDDDGPAIPAPPKVTDPPGTGPRDPRLLTRDEMVSLAGQYHDEIDAALAHVEQARQHAVRERDIIKMTCIDDKLAEMKMIAQAISPRFKTLNRRPDEFAARAEFIAIEPAWKRVKVLQSDASICVGESLETVTVMTVSHEAPTVDGPDPSSVAPPRVDAERPAIDRNPEASPYR